MPALFDPAPPVPATPPAHGLTSVAQEVQTPARWKLGISVTPENCVNVDTVEHECDSWPDGEKPEFPDAPDNVDTYTAEPFLIVTSFKCDAQQHAVLDYAGRARRQLEAGTPKGLEYELWTGTQRPNNPHLATGATMIGEAAFPPKLALSLLGQALANCYHGGQGVIHAPVWIVDLWADGGMLKEVGNRLQTLVRGDLVVAGSGYPGTGPEGVAPGNLQSYVFATGPVQYRLEDGQVFPDTLKEALNIRTNDVEYTAQRLALANFDPCCHFGILVQASEVE